MKNSLRFALFLALATLDNVSTSPINGQITGDLSRQPPARFNHGKASRDNSTVNAVNLLAGVLDQAHMNASKLNYGGMDMSSNGQSGKGRMRPGFPAKVGKRPSREDDKSVVNADNLPISVNVPANADAKDNIILRRGGGSRSDN